MALTVINEPSFGGRLGTAVGSGLGGLLENLVQSKAQQVQQNQRALGYEKGFGLNPEQAKVLSSLPDDFQQVALKSLIEQQQAAQFNRTINPEQYGEPFSALSQGLSTQPQQPSLDQAMRSFQGGEPQNAIEMALQKGLPKIVQQEQQLGKAAQLPAERPMVPPQPQNQSIEDVFKNRPLTPQLAGKAAELELKKQQHAEKLAAAKEERVEKRENILRKDLNDISKHAERARQDINALHQIKAANDSGTLIQGQKRKLLEQFGLQDYFTNTSTQYVAKNIERMVTGATEAFGTGRLTNFLAESYSKALPRLINTKEGMDLLIKNLILEKKADISLNDEIRKLKSESREGGKPLPFDIEDQARDRIQPKIETYARESLANIEKAIGGGSKNSFESLPKAADYSGKTITDTKTGTKYKSNGSKWVKV
jgi:hypothetical protein